MAYRDKTFCASPGCTNQCGRMLPESEKKLIPEWMPVAYAYFCGMPDTFYDKNSEDLFVPNTSAEE